MRRKMILAREEMTARILAMLGPGWIAVLLEVWLSRGPQCS